MTTNFPGSVDSFPRPSSTTNTDDPGFELDVVIDNLSDALEAVETRSLSLGPSSLAAPPVKPIVGRWYTGTVSNLAAGKGVTTTDHVFHPIVFGHGVTLDRLGMFITATVAASTVRLGVCASAADGLPGVRVVDGGTVDSSTSGEKTVTVSTALSAGAVYWLVFSGSTTGITAWGTGTPMGYDLGRASGNWDTPYQALYLTGRTAAVLDSDYTSVRGGSLGLAFGNYARPLVRIGSVT